jgi:hypothetical protein
LNLNDDSYDNVERDQIAKVMNSMNQSLANFTKNLKKTNKFKVVHTTIDGVEASVYEGYWTFKENSKYKVPTNMKW